MSPPVGVVAPSTLPPQDVPAFAALVERLGFEQVWFGEDYFWTAGISAATAALAATQRIPVGIGIVSAMVRHPAVLALEIATIERIFPGRLRPAIALGQPTWIAQMGRKPGSQLGALRETVDAVVRLLDGETLERVGAEYTFHDVSLEYPCDPRPPVFMGAVGPKMHTLAGEVADATLSGVLGSPAYLRAVRHWIAAGRAAGGRPTGHHPLVTYAIYSVDDDPALARDAVREMVGFYLSTQPRSAVTDVLGYRDELDALYAAGGGDARRIAREVPQAWLEELAVAGTPAQCAAKIDALLGAGADTVCLCLAPAERYAEILELTARAVLPHVRAY